MPDLGKIFVGVTPKPFRDFLTLVFSKTVTHYPTLIVPCAGRFTGVELALAAGYKPQNIWTSDISLYSSVLGYLASGQELASLAVEGDFPVLYKDPSQIDFAVMFMLAMKRAQLARGKTYFEKCYLREFDENIAKYRAQMERQLQSYVERLHGVHYHIADMWAEIDQWKDRADACLYINPPGYSKGYTKMFDWGGAITWNSPEIAEFEPKTDHLKMYDLLMDAKSFAVMYRYKQVEDSHKSYIAFSSVFTKERADHILVNRRAEIKTLARERPTSKIHAPKIPILPNRHPVTPESRIQFASCSKEEALYIRDLWTHRLGVTRSEGYYFALLDGYLFSVFGCFFELLRHWRTNYIQETFGFTAPSQYVRLNKLFMFCLVSMEAQQFFVRDSNLHCYEVKGLQTTCLSQYPELKTNRGIFQLRERKKTKTGYYLNYYTDFGVKDATFTDCLNRWLSKDAGVVK